MARQVKCPKCGRPQELSGYCVQCGLDFRAYARKVREKREAGIAGTTAPETAGLRDIGRLFEDSWSIYKERFATLFILNLLSGAFLLAPVMLLALLGLAAGVFGQDLLGIGAAAGAVTGALAGSVLMFIPIAGLISALENKDMGIKDALRAGRDRLWPFLWLIGLAWLLITGGFLLFAVPGVIYAIWFLPAQFIVVLEKDKGMKALLKSRLYMRGRFWGVFGRAMLIVLLYGTASALPGGGLLFAPFMYIMFYLIYRDLRAEKNRAATAPAGTREKLWIIIPALMGYALIAAIIVAGLFSVFDDKEYIKKLSPTPASMICRYDRSPQGPPL